MYYTVFPYAVKFVSESLNFYILKSEYWYINRLIYFFSYKLFIKIIGIATVAFLRLSCKMFAGQLAHCL